MRTTTRPIRFQVEGSVAFVTGTSRERGIGRGIVRALIAKGCRKVYATARDISQLDDLVAISPRSVVPVALDVTDFSAIEQVPMQCPDVTLLVHNAGYLGNTTNSSTIMDVPLETARREMDVNYFGVLALTQAFANQLWKRNKNLQIDRKTGIAPTAVVVVSSIAAILPNNNAASYGCSKAANLYLTRTIRNALYESTFVQCVLPGPIETDMLDAMNIRGGGLSADQCGRNIVADLEQGVDTCLPDPWAKRFFDEWKASPDTFNPMGARNY